MSLIDRTLLQQLYNVAVTRNPIIFLYIIKKFNRERHFLKNFQEKGYFSIESNEDDFLSLQTYFEKYLEKNNNISLIDFAEDFVKKLELLGIVYKIKENLYSIETKINVDFDLEGTSLKQIHNSVGKGYSKSYMQRIIIGRLKNPKSMFDGKNYPIIESESISGQKTKIFVLNENVYNAIKNEDDILGQAISDIFFLELNLKNLLDRILERRKSISRIKIQFESLKMSQVSEINQFYNINKKKEEKNDEDEKILGILEKLIALIKKIKKFRKDLGDQIKKLTKLKSTVENHLKQLNRLSFAELKSFLENFNNKLNHYDGKKINIFDEAKKQYYDADSKIKTLNQQSIAKLNLNYQKYYLDYINFKNELDW